MSAAPTPAKRDQMEADDLACALRVLDTWTQYAPDSLMRIWAAGRIRRSGNARQIDRLVEMEARDAKA